MGKFVLFFVMVLSFASFAQEKAIWDCKETKSEILWQRVLAVHTPKVKDPEPTLIGGSVPNMKDFPATSFTGSCTTTAVGQRVAIIAAHCTGGQNQISFPIGPSKYTAQCTDSKDYDGNETADYSLCLTTKAIEGAVFETINLDPQYLQKGSKILLGGYGCTDVGGRGGIDGLFRIGIAEIVRMPSGTNNDIVTSDKTAICYGDSGGAAWGLNPDGSRGKLISVNSRGDISKTSYLSALHTTQFKRFIDAWSGLNPEGRICGYHEDAKNCRGLAPPEAPADFVLTGRGYPLSVSVKPSEKYKAADVKAALIKAGF